MRRTLISLVALAAPTVLVAQAQQGRKAADPISASAPKLDPIVSFTTSEMASVVDWYAADQAALRQRYDAPDSPEQRRRMREFYDSWRARLREQDFNKLSQEGRIDYVLLDSYLKHQLALLDRQIKQKSEVAVLMPFAERLLALQDARRNLNTPDPAT